MALTRKMLKALGIEEEKIEQIIDAHTETVDALKLERDGYKEDAEKLPGVQKELDDLKKDVADNDWKGKFDKEHGDFEKFKKDVQDKQTLEAVKSAYRKLLSKCKVGDKQIDAVMKVTDFSNMKLDKDGNLEDATKLEENINSTWSGFISSTGTRGSAPDTPPAGGEGGSNKGGRAAELAAKYRENLYGKEKEA